MARRLVRAISSGHWRVASALRAYSPRPQRRATFHRSGACDTPRLFTTGGALHPCVRAEGNRTPQALWTSFVLQREAFRGAHAWTHRRDSFWSAHPVCGTSRWCSMGLAQVLRTAPPLSTRGALDRTPTTRFASDDSTGLTLLLLLLLLLLPPPLLLLLLLQQPLLPLLLLLLPLGDMSVLRSRQPLSNGPLSV